MSQKKKKAKTFDFVSKKRRKKSKQQLFWNSLERGFDVVKRLKSHEINLFSTRTSYKLLKNLQRKKEDHSKPKFSW